LIKVYVHLRLYDTNKKVIKDYTEVELEEGQKLRNLLQSLSGHFPSLSIFDSESNEKYVWCCTNSKTILLDDPLDNGAVIFILPLMDGG